ncbi:MAG: helix-turn-helix domain-containing protein [Myxococcota bacterium]|jgi:DNA-binding XRE family transcriptional regulator|nr:helix-turn-helix domain-containing protein [Myxococcota bacterium]
MLARTPEDLGSLVREHRLARAMTQAQLAQAIGTSRQWVVDLERGKPTLALGLVLRAVTAVGLSLRVETGSSSAAPLESSSSAVSLDPALAAIDLDAVLARARRPANVPYATGSLATAARPTPRATKAPARSAKSAAAASKPPASKPAASKPPASKRTPTEPARAPTKARVGKKSAADPADPAKEPR